MTEVQDPTVTPQLRERARQNPESWIYVVDPGFEDAPEVPGWAVVGAYRVDERGEVVDELRPNPNYRPTPAALGFPPPANELEGALQRAVTGHADDNEVRAALLEATVFVPHLSGTDGVAGLDAGLDQRVVHAFTSERYLPEPVTWRHWERLPVRDLAEALGGRYLLLNPDSELELRLPGRDLD
ncbi:type VII secretion system-associated protein [Micromonospora sp. NPDC004704]